MTHASVIEAADWFIKKNIFFKKSLLIIADCTEVRPPEGRGAEVLD